MPRYQYRREQRVDIIAASEAEAWAIAENLSLDSEADESDDPGELELIDEETVDDPASVTPTTGLN